MPMEDICGRTGPSREEGTGMKAICFGEENGSDKSHSGAARAVSDVSAYPKSI